MENLTIAALQALIETSVISALGPQFAGIDKRFEQIDERFDEIDLRFNEVLKAIGERFDENEEILRPLTGRVNGHEGRLAKLETAKAGRYL